MKKFFVLIALIGLCIPAIRGLPADVEEKYNIVKHRHKLEQLKECIHNADAITFEKQFIPSLPIKCLLELERLVNERKKTTRFELSGMGSSDTSLSIVATGLLEYAVAVAGSGYSYISLYPGGLPKFCAGAVIFYMGTIYGYTTTKTGLNYKQYLQDRLTNLDAIAAHIAYEKSLVCPAPVINAPVAEEPVIQAKTVSACDANVGVRRNK